MKTTLTPDELKALCDKITVKLGIKIQKVELNDITMEIKHFGHHVDLWDEALIKIKDSEKYANRRPSVTSLLAVYKDLCDKHVTTECLFCRSTGYLEVITLSGLYKGQKKTWIFNPDTKANQGNIKWLKQRAESGQRFIAENKVLPCVCENGEKRNQRGSQEWLTKEQRARARDRAFRIQEEGAIWHMWQWLDYLKCITEGRIENYQAQTWQQKAEELRQKGIEYNPKAFK